MFGNAYYSNKNWNRLFLLVGVVYALIMVKLLLLRGANFYWDTYNYNLIPMKTIKQYIFYRERFNDDIWIKNLFGNIVLFIPLGILIPLLSKRFLSTITFIVLIVATIFSVEIVQMLTKVGSFDIDDIILNTLGAFIGLVLLKLILIVFPKKYK